ncbi:SET domain-containing protein [Photobacterium leiognathi]|uniref:SET domain-containing protein n=1 Tax=Photobacterium leiognathi TaxID=553611 RepID=UPI0029818E54|nr:SET domain-containing protein [Photobacterium leiognathi]
MKELSLFRELSIDISDGAVVGRSMVHGLGVFTLSSRKSGEEIAKIGGKIMSNLDYLTIKDRVLAISVESIDSFEHVIEEFSDYWFLEATCIGEHFVLLRPIRDKFNYLSHSSDPNVSLDLTTMTVRAIKPIEAGEELFINLENDCLNAVEQVKEQPRCV